MGEIIAVCISEKRGTSKKNIKKGVLRENYGLEGDAHAGKWHRQVSLLAKESLEEIEKTGMKIGCGGFAENITTKGIELVSLNIGTRLSVGNEKALLEVTQIGKECKDPCQIYKKLGNCILPSQGIFTKVLRGGMVKVGDKIEVLREGKFQAGTLIVSDRCSRGERKDLSGKIIEDLLRDISCSVIRYTIVPDELEDISGVLKQWSDSGELDLIFTSGGTGFSPRDNTPEATRKVIQKEAPGIAEFIRAKGACKTERAYLSRGIAGIRKKTLIVNLPGSPDGVKDAVTTLTAIIPHAIEVLRGDVKDCQKIK
ncbi:molybdenum cofactor biosynthesis protein [candidate division KSB1 bacterium]|nr:MAG: molybdenum cofactor biosynthesis protein [candidate division KSB1 bacterium]